MMMKTFVMIFFLTSIWNTCVQDTASSLDIDKDDFNPSSGCYFSITLPEDVPGNLQDMIAVGEDPEEARRRYWKMVFLCDCTCDKRKDILWRSKLVILDCSFSAQPPLSSIDYTQSNPALENGDVYIWLSDVYLSHVTGVISPSLQDMVFKRMESCRHIRWGHDGCRVI